MMKTRKGRTNATDIHVGVRLRMRRMMLSMSQEQLAKALQLTFQQIQKYEKGANRISASRLEQICRVLSVPVAFFFEGAPTPKGMSPAPGMAPSPEYVMKFMATAEGLALTRAFTKIKSRKMKHSIVALVEQLAGLDLPADD